MMSKVKLMAVKELIQEKRYTEARIILKNIDHPTAHQWLAKLDKLEPAYIPDPPPRPQTNIFNSPPPPISAEAERYYRQQNRRTKLKRIKNAFYLIIGGIFCFAIFILLLQPIPSIEAKGQMVTNVGIGWVFIPLGLLAIVGGIYLILKKD